MRYRLARIRKAPRQSKIDRPSSRITALNNIVLYYIYGVGSRGWKQRWKEWKLAGKRERKEAKSKIKAERKFEWNEGGKQKKGEGKTLTN
jgi:hypothetical protein